jgi:DNA excision repair protein ERCC-2
VSDTPVVAIAITELVDFSCRRGDLVPPALPSVTMMQGIIAHQRVQAARRREEGYQAEFAIALPWQWQDTPLLLRGRIDGVWMHEPRIEEIKTLAGDAGGLAAATRDLHWAQARFYAFCLCEMHGFGTITAQLTYANIEGRIVESEARHFTRAELAQFVEPHIATFVEWQRFRQLHRATRNACLASMRWPFAEFRAQQRVIAETVYKAIHQHSALLSEAPTGTGKTMAHLFPALKALASAGPRQRQRAQRIVWLTAKTSAQHTVLQALQTLLHGNGDTMADDNGAAPLRILQLGARDKLCFCRQPGNDCPSPCSCTVGYYDRLPEVRRAACELPVLDVQSLTALASHHAVCPFQLGLDLINEADVIIGDVNYVFDPLIALNSLTGDGAADTVLLIDEAHNLIERSREMYSATLAISDVLALIAEVKTVSRSAALKFQRLLKKLTALEHSDDVGFADIGEILRAMLDHYGSVAAQTDMPQGAVERLRPLVRATVISELADVHHRLLMTRENGDLLWRIANLDPAARNERTLQLFHAAVLFSGTLTPIDYSRAQLGLAADAPVLCIASPFVTDNLHVCICTHIDTRWQRREAGAAELAALIAAVTAQREGNYLCAFPSYQYLEQVRQHLVVHNALNIIAQTPSWNDQDRADVIAHLKSAAEPTLVMGIIGGSLGESIDLPGDALIGVIVVGVGLHAPDTVSEARRQYYESQGADGFALAYQFPGWQRVVQTAGRLIRGEHDKGVLVLVDPRHARSDYRRLWPAHWHVNIAKSSAQCVEGIASFWTRIDTRL